MRALCRDCIQHAEDSVMDVNDQATITVVAIDSVTEAGWGVCAPVRCGLGVRVPATVFVVLFLATKGTSWYEHHAESRSRDFDVNGFRACGCARRTHFRPIPFPTARRSCSDMTSQRISGGRQRRGDINAARLMAVGCCHTATAYFRSRTTPIPLPKNIKTPKFLQLN